MARKIISYQDLIKHLGMTVSEIAVSAGVTVPYLERHPKSVKIQQQLRKIYCIYETLSKYNKDEDIGKLLRAPIKDYAGKSLMDIILTGHADAVERYIDDMKKGTLS